MAETVPYSCPPDALDAFSAAIDLTKDGPITDPDDLVDVFNAIGETLEGVGIPTPFHRIYGALTREVNDTVKRSRNDPADPPASMEGPVFENPDTVAGAMGIFFHFYAEALSCKRDQLYGDDKALGRMTDGWWYSLGDPHIRDTDPVLQFVSGMYTHIYARDLGRTLWLSGVTDDYRGDYTTIIQELIGKVTAAFSEELMPGHSLLRPMTEKLVVVGIGRMRETAWNDFKYMQTLPQTDHESYMRYMDVRAARYVRHIRRYGGTLLGLASLTEGNPLRRSVTA